MLLHWFITFWGNLAGSLFVMAIITGYGGTFSTTAQHSRVVTFATAKAITPAWHQVFLRGIGANWLVCLACFLSFMGREFFSKVVGIWWPTFAFVMLSFDHVVANMFYIPLGIFVGTPGLTVGHYIAYSMMPALIGNIVGGGLFVGVIYWYLVRMQSLLKRTSSALTDFNHSTLPRTTSQT
jgi:formate/nitrite transporter